jgi:dephospho-CoA kinase
LSLKRIAHVFIRKVIKIFVIGIAGKTGSGKSTAAGYLQSCLKDSLLIDGDKIAKEIYLSDRSAREQVRTCFGDFVLKADGQIDYRKLGKLVFSSKEKLCSLNDIMLPRIESAVKEKLRLNTDKKYLIIDAAILFNTGIYKICDFIIWVRADRRRRQEMLAEKSGLTEDEITLRVEGQMVKRIPSRIDFILDNNGTVEEMQDKINSIVANIGDTLNNKSIG